MEGAINEKNIDFESMITEVRDTDTGGYYVVLPTFTLSFWSVSVMFSVKAGETGIGGDPQPGVWRDRDMSFWSSTEKCFWMGLFITERKDHLSRVYFWLQKTYKVDIEHELRNGIKLFYRPIPI